MTRQQAKDNLELIKAFAEGENIEFKSRISHTWRPCEILSFDPDCRYRIKPKPKYRPWTMDEVPVGAVTRVRGCFTDNYQFVILAYDEDAVFFVNRRREIEQYTYFNLLDNREYSLDGGKTWLPCGVEEKE